MIILLEKIQSLDAPVAESSPASTDPLTLELDLPDPEKDDISTLEFFSQLEKAWAVCDRFDLQTEIWRGRILRAVRDREKRGGEGRGAGFLQWLREREISKSRAYGLIKLADSSDSLVGGGLLEEKRVNQFSKRAFLETAQASPEVQLMISEAANEGQEITRKQVRRLSDDFMSVTCPLLPEKIRQQAQENLLPSRVVAPLARELAKLPTPQQEDLCQTLSAVPEIQVVKNITNKARWISKAIESCQAIRAFQNDQFDLEKAMQEAERLDSLGQLSDALRQAQAIEASVLKFYTATKRLGLIQEKLWVESGSSTPYLRDVLDSLQALCGATMRVSLGDLAGGKRIRLQIVEETPDHIEPPNIDP